MAKSDEHTMKRLDRVEHAIAQVSTILAEQSERIDSGFHQVRGEIQQTREALSERLDRLIAVTIQERTPGIERLAEIERRLARLEQHTGL